MNAEQTSPAPTVSSERLLDAESTLKDLTDQMAAECQTGMSKWPREWMQKHSNDRATIIKARNILIDRAEAETRKPCSDQGDGYWDCSKLQKCVKPQCADCPQKASNDPGEPRRAE